MISCDGLAASVQALRGLFMSRGLKASRRGGSTLKIRPSEATVKSLRLEYEDVNIAQSTFGAVLSPRDASKLRALRQQDADRTWHSLDDHRVCIVCGNEFRGREILIRADRGRIRCQCPTPGCSGDLKQFVLPGNPLLETAVWRDWLRALDDDELEPEVDLVQRPARAVARQAIGAAVTPQPRRG